MGCVVQSFEDLELSEDSVSLSSQSVKSIVQDDKPYSTFPDCSETIKHSESTTTMDLKSEDCAQKDWSITFKQFQGTLYTQQFLISQFDHRINISAEIEQYRKRCFEKMITS